jgi:hypothetical protein
MDAVNITPGSAGTTVNDPGILYPLMLIAAIAVIVFSIAGIAAMMGWIPGALSSGAEPAKARPAAAPQQAAPRIPANAAACRDCGVVESLRAMEKSVRYEIRVRMSDGSLRTHYEATRPALRVGQKVRVTERGVIAAG